MLTTWVVSSLVWEKRWSESFLDRESMKSYRCAALPWKDLPGFFAELVKKEGVARRDFS